MQKTVFNEWGKQSHQNQFQESHRRRQEEIEVKDTTLWSTTKTIGFTPSDQGKLLKMSKYVLNDRNKLISWFGLLLLPWIL